MMRFLDTLVARLILVLLIGISLVHVVSIWTYERALEREFAEANEGRLADRILAIRSSVIAVSEAQREALAHELSSGPLEAHWNRTRAARSGGPGADQWHGLIERIRSGAANLGAEDIVLGTSDDAHSALLSVRLPDASWLNVNLFTPSQRAHGGHGTVLSTSIMAGGVIAISLLIARWLTRPLRTMARGVSMLSPGGPVTRISVTGPLEVRQLAHAFNDMSARISELVERRTQALAAVSHDLRTPITRLKLRLDDVRDTELKQTMLADLAEMESMIEATLAYLRGQDVSEPVRPINLVSLLETIVDDARDAGREAQLEAPQSLVVMGRHLGLKRALTNLVGNALRFGTTVAVRANAVSDGAVIEILDDGPGIPPDKLEVVFDPFVRLDTSRNRESGGVGLGLAIAKANIEADGGTLALRNAPQGGLVAEIRLPLRIS